MNEFEELCNGTDRAKWRHCASAMLSALALHVQSRVCNNDHFERFLLRSKSKGKKCKGKIDFVYAMTAHTRAEE
jgi:hypothetical protein